MAVLWLGRCGFHSISTTLSHKATFAVLGTIRKRVCAKLSRVPLGTVLDIPSGSIKNVLVERIDSIETTMAHIIPEFTSNLLVPIALLVYLFILDWRMALAVLATVPIGFGCYALMTRDYEESYQNTINKTKILNDTAVEYINGIEVIKAFGKAQSSYDKFVAAAKEGASCYVEWMRRCNIYFCIAMSVFPATMVAVLPIGGLLFRAGTLDANTFIQVILFSVGLIASLITVMSYGDDLAKLGTIIGEVTDILEQEEQERPQVSTAVPNNNDIVLDRVSFGYHEKEVLHGIDMTIREGTVNALVGPSGSGKSTIAKLIAGLWDVKSGSISIGGMDIRQMTQQDYNQYIAYVSQDNYLFDTTVMENIRMGNQSATDEEVIAAAKAAHADSFIRQLPDGAGSKELNKTAAQIEEALRVNGESTVVVGMGTIAMHLRDLAKSYKEAQIAIEVGKVFDTEKYIINYENLGIGRLIYQLPTTLCEMFLQEVFKKNPIDALDKETLFTIHKFFENNLNVSETARKLFVHRNTLVYRLEKIKKLTGLDLREFDDAITFKVALMVKKYLTSRGIDS